jgi:hypothetical protein
MYSIRLAIFVYFQNRIISGIEYPIRSFPVGAQFLVLTEGGDVR